MTHVQACLSGRKKEKAVFTTCGGLMKLVQTCLYAGNTIHFHRQGGAVKHVQACLIARKDGDLSFHNCGGPVKLVLTCL